MDIAWMQANTRFVKDIHDIYQAATQVFDHFDAL